MPSNFLINLNLTQSLIQNLPQTSLISNFYFKTSAFKFYQNLQFHQANLCDLTAERSNSISVIDQRRVIARTKRPPIKMRILIKSFFSINRFYIFLSLILVCILMLVIEALFPKSLSNHLLNKQALNFFDPHRTDSDDDLQRLKGNHLK